MRQQFGGTWTAEKLEALQFYLESYALALKSQPFELHYIDAFAGIGSFVPTAGGAVRRGSASIALAVSGFHKYHFIEKSPRKCKKLLGAIPPDLADRVEVHAGDANVHLRAILASLKSNARAVLFLDPFGMHLDWSTLELIQQTRKVDVWYLFPLSGITRQLALDVSRVDEKKRDSLDRTLGTTTWRNAFYQAPATGDLFSAPADERSAGGDSIELWLTDRLRGLFACVIGPRLLRLSVAAAGDDKTAPMFPGLAGEHHKRRRSGPKLFALYCLISNPRAVKVARNIAEGVFTRLDRDAASLGKTE